jgi:hypothetical protein
MPKKLYEISLTQAERAELVKMVKTGTSSARTILRANILLQSDTSGHVKPIGTREMAALLNTSATTIENVRKEYAGSGLKDTLARKKRETPPVPAKIDGCLEAKIIALSCQDPPQGYARWSTRLLADRTVELGYVDSISHTAVAGVLKKTSSSPT